MRNIYKLTYGIYGMKGGNPKGGFSDDVLEIGQLSGKLILTPSN